jgi:ADP-heptose:LPS heptosyltransferase
VIRLGSLGDVVRTRFALPGLRALYPQASIDWLVEDRCAAGLTGVSGLDEIVPVPRAALQKQGPGAWIDGLRRTVGALRERRYDLSVDFHSVLKSALLARWARIPQRVGYDRGFAREGCAFLFTHRARIEPLHLPRFERNAALVRYLGGDPGDRMPALELPQFAAGELPALPERYAIVHPGTSGGTLYKRWPAGRYAQVARGIHAEQGLRSLVTWGPVAGEREVALEVVEAAGDCAVLAPATRSLGVLLTLLQRAALFVGSDSGPVHLAALCGLPQVVLFGPTDPIENALFPGNPHRALRRDVGCNPCREGCPVRTCMGALEPRDVVAAAADLLARGRCGPSATAEPEPPCYPGPLL